MKKKTIWFILIGLLLVAMVSGALLMGRDVTVTVDGQTVKVHTYALTVRQLLSSMGYKLTNTDEVVPPAGTWLSKNVDSVTLDRAHEFSLWVGPTGNIYQFISTVDTPRGLLALAGIEPAPEDIIRINGQVYTLDQSLPNARSIVLQYIPAIPVAVKQNGTESLIRSTDATLGQALWAGNIRLKGGDALAIPFSASLQNAQEITLTKATPLTIQVDGRSVRSLSMAATVGQALQNNGISLQNLDYSTPSEDSPLPADGAIKVVRVREEVQVEQQSLPFKMTTREDNTLELDQRKEVSTGQYGLAISRVLVRYEDGVEVSRTTEETTTLVQPVDQVVAYGTQIVLHTMDTGYGTTITYYRKASVYATSYSPCRLARADGSSACGYKTASGTTMRNGVVAVSLDWYYLFKGSQVYIPGYGQGSIEDTGGGIPGRYWIDLGYDDASWVSWSSWVTVYFLAPAPANVPLVLP
jgi:resuscitation-promoting factor RpfB